ncbi:MAG: MMPL family transporter [Candidatus Omnitrophica bacterium]|nr:MMPL family transporter [Candidatus Omnitrophota bacterium]MBD3268890.1 MMPL family transporter [Candidatus Omnitrophota bacterium]
MSGWPHTFARKIIHLRIYVIICFLAISAFFVSVLKDIEVETRLQDFLPQKHPFLQVQHKLTDVFGGLSQVSLALEVKEGTIFDKDFLEKVVCLTEDLYLLDKINISRINSIASRHTKHVTVTEEGFFVERLLRYPPRSEEEMNEFRLKVVGNPNVYGKLVSSDLKSTLIQADFESDARTSYIFDSLMKLKEKYEGENIRIYIAGRSVLEGWINFYLPKMFKILILSFGIIAAILYMTFRSKRGVFLPLLDSSMATLWGMGTMKLIGLRLDPSTVLVPFIVLSLGISHSVHTLKRYYDEMRNPRAKSKHAVVNAMSHLFLPGVACVLTDGFGFLSLMLVPLSTIKSMALASGLGILANFFTSFMFTPCILSFMHKPKILEIEREEQHKWVDKWLAKLSIFSLNKKAGTLVVSVFVLLCLFSFWGIKKIVIGDNSAGSSYLYQKSPYNQSERFINSNFGGTNSYYVLVESPDSIFKEEKLKAMDSFQNHILSEVPGAGSATSVVDAIKALNMFMFGGEKEYYRIPPNDKTIAQYWFLYTLSGFPSDYDHLINRRENKANIKFDFKDHTSDTVTRAVEETKQFLKGKTFKDLKFSYAGGDIGITYAVNDIIAKTILPNILFISFLIFVYVSFVYRSFTAGWVLLLPLILSNLIVFSLFGWLHTSINTETLPLAALSEGLGINFGIYILARLHEEIKSKKRTYRSILYHTLTTSGKAVFFSGFIVALGILSWVLSPIRLQARLGINLCVSLVLNMVISLIMIPVLIWWIKPVFLFGKIRQRLKRSKKGT